MNVVFPPVDEEYLKNKVDSGFYSNITEAVRDAVRRMREDDEKRKLEALRAALAIGLEQAERRELIPYSLDFMDSAMKSALENAQRGKPVKDEIKPA